MKSSSLFIDHYGYLTAAVLVVSMVAGCSGSGNSNSTSDNNAAELNETVEETTTIGNESNQASAGNTTTIDTTPTNESVEDIQDSVSSSSTRVNFDITVPAITSNELQVQVLWGRRTLTADWVTGVSWALEVDFIADVENPLTVIFSDQNGAITLGSFEQAFRTGTNASESFRITADQFDTVQWDNDNDGLSNLDELLAGTNPLVEGAAPLVGSISTAEAVSTIFEIAGGNVITAFGDAVRSLVLSTDGSEYPLLSTAPGLDYEGWTTISDRRTYECPLFGTVERSEYRQEGVGTLTLLVSLSCTDSEQVINGTLSNGRSFASGDEKAFTNGIDVSFTFNDGSSLLEADSVEQTLPFEDSRAASLGLPRFGIGEYNGNNISLSENGVVSYRLGTVSILESNRNNFIPNVRQIGSSAIDIDEISNIRALQKTEGSEFFTSGSFAVNKNGVQVFLIDADTGDENTFSVISTIGDSTTSEIFNWSDYRQINNFPLAE